MREEKRAALSVGEGGREREREREREYGLYNTALLRTYHLAVHCQPLSHHRLKIGGKFN